MIILYINYPQCSALVTFSLSLLSSVAVMFLFLALLPYWVLTSIGYTHVSIHPLGLLQRECFSSCATTASVLCMYAAEFQIHCILRETADQGRLARAVCAQCAQGT